MSRRKYVNKDPYYTNAKFDSVCHETGKAIKKGERCLYYPIGRAVYHLESNQARLWADQQQADNFGLLDANW